MSNKRIFIVYLITVFLVSTFIQNAIAGPDWKEKQAQRFAEIPVKPGDVIDKSNWEKAKDLLPEHFANTVKTGDWILNIAEFKYDHDFDTDYYNLSAQNAGKYTLGPKKEILDVKTGTFPMFISGMPFPNIDMVSDADGPAKFMHNSNLNLFMEGSYKSTQLPPAGSLQFIGRKGLERFTSFTQEVNYYWNRPGGEIPNPREYKFTSFLVSRYPFDLKGTATLYVRHLDGSDDSVYAYVPAIRRVKRLSGANRSDPQMGSDQTMDDSEGFAGHIESMSWEYIGEKVMLKPIYKEQTKAPKQSNQDKDGGWVVASEDMYQLGYQVPGWTGAPWAYTNLAWVPREMYVFKATPLDPFYAYGVMEIYVDKLTTEVSFNMKYTRSGEFWKMIIYSPQAVAWKGGKKIFAVNGPSCVYDAKTDHASPTNLDGQLMTLDSPRVNPANHTPQNLRTATK